ncbi:MAG: Nif3-like dinuclear metal center hexameric protein [Phycisphaerae bacterium]|jgi:dinuclear metal center YbgI/SA1388 family protein
MKIKDVIKQIERLTPPNLAQGWDNTGLLVGSGNERVKNILLAIDITKAVLSEAKKLKAEMIISYHPVIWDGLKNITDRGDGNIVYELIKAGIAVYSMHTSLDVVAGGVNDGLAEMVGIVDAKPIGDYVQDDTRDNYKLVVFVPVGATDKVTNAIFAAGAGWIGNYSNCGFRTAGKGSFLPRDGARPTIGKKGKIETVEEIRFECIVPSGKLDCVLAALKKAHPYEEPAFDVFKLYNPQDRIGLGRIGKLAKAATVKEIIAKVKRATGAKAVGIVGKSQRTVKSAAVCAGSCGKIINLIIAQCADLYVTGELKHHQAIAAQEAGMTCLCLSHSVSERFILKKLAKVLQNQAKEVKISVSKKDADPFVWKEI